MIPILGLIAGLIIGIFLPFHILQEKIPTMRLYHWLLGFGFGFFGFT